MEQAAKSAARDLLVVGRGKELQSILAFLTSPKEELFIYGRPGTGKTYLLRKIAEHLGRSISVYFLNMVSEQAFSQVGEGREDTTLLIVDEYEGAYRRRFYLKARQELFRGDGPEKRKCKTIFLSNRRGKGLEFRKYARADMEEILRTSLKKEAGTKKEVEHIRMEGEVEMQSRISEGYDRGDIRVALSRRAVGGSSTDNLYHQLIREITLQGVTDVNRFYSIFVARAREQNMQILPKEEVKTIKEVYE